MDGQMFYVGIKPCGCCVAACVDKPEYAKETAKSLAEWVKSGWRIERVGSDYIKANLAWCKCGSKKQESLFAEATP